MLTTSICYLVSWVVISQSFKCRPYEDVLYDIAVTHSPRYLINMEIEKSDTIFSKMGTTYDEFRVSPDNISQVRKYYRERAIERKRFEMPWWITPDNVETAHSFNTSIPQHYSLRSTFIY